MTERTPEEILADPNSHPIHMMYARINIGVRDRGEQWFMCANCGVPYMLNAFPEDDWADTTVCSNICFKAFLRSMNEGW